jgi:hypothetical protein
VRPESNVLKIKGKSGPPEDLSEFQATLWRTIMDGPSSELIPPEAYPILRQYLSAAEVCEQYEVLLLLLGEPTGIEWFRDHDKIMTKKLAAMKELGNLGVKLRLAPSSRADRDKAATISRKPRGAKPWEVE